ncbi:MAG: hypothetical protein Q7S44_00745 [bacterium]|nr:hypothetical protein [bacterium]
MTQPPTKTPEVLQVRIVAPKKILFSEAALAVSSTNSAGKFDILPEHANFVTLVELAPIIITKVNEETVKFQFPLAIIYARNNKVNIYTDIQLSITEEGKGN